MKRAIVAMSGGVDSSVTAALLLREGAEVIGLTFDLWPGASDAAIRDAQAVCRALDIPHHVLNRREAFERAVVQEFRAEYLRGRTPNPCVRCNPRIKFALLKEAAGEFGADTVATGHYVSTATTDDIPSENRSGLSLPASRRFLLRRARDVKKDQSYVLYGLAQDQLALCRFPMGDLVKSETRRIAQEMGLRTHDRPDSQEICFIPENDYAAFIDRFAPECVRPGIIVDTSGRRCAEHRGIHRFTLGQRKGLGFAAGSPRYVVRIDAESGTVVVGTKEETLRERFEASGMNWMALANPTTPFDAEVKIRYTHRPAAARITPLPGERARIEFHSPESAVTPGQAAVIYRGDFLLGGGTIESD